MVFSTQAPRLSLALLLVALTTTGCLHYSNMEACVPTGTERECWVSSGTGKQSGNEYVVIERVSEGGACDEVEVESSVYDPSSTLIERVVEVRRCGVTERRSEYRYDLARGVIASRVERDLDHDDLLDFARSYERPMTDNERALLARSVPAPMASRSSGPTRNW